MSGFNDNYNSHMIYMIIILFILLLLDYTQALFNLTTIIKNILNEYLYTVLSVNEYTPVWKVTF